jgi:hypothetical protein
MGFETYGHREFRDYRIGPNLDLMEVKKLLKRTIYGNKEEELLMKVWSCQHHSSKILKNLIVVFT